MWCDLCQKVWNWREEEAKRGDNKGTVYKVWKKRHNRRKSIRTRKKRDSVPRI